MLLIFSACLTPSAFLFCLLHIKAPGGHELSCDFWELVGLAPAGGADNLINEESDVDVQLNNRHMMIRGENMSKILKARSMITSCFRDHFFDRGYYEVSACYTGHLLRVVPGAIWKWWPQQTCLLLLTLTGYHSDTGADAGGRWGHTLQA